MFRLLLVFILSTGLFYTGRMRDLQQCQALLQHNHLRQFTSAQLQFLQQVLTTTFAAPAPLSSTPQILKNNLQHPLPAPLRLEIQKLKGQWFKQRQFLIQRPDFLSLSFTWMQELPQYHLWAAVGTADTPSDYSLLYDWGRLSILKNLNFQTKPSSDVVQQLESLISLMNSRQRWQSLIWANALEQRLHHSLGNPTSSPQMQMLVQREKALRLAEQLGVFSQFTAPMLQALISLPISTFTCTLWQENSRWLQPALAFLPSSTLSGLSSLTGLLKPWQDLSLLTAETCGLKIMEAESSPNSLTRQQYLQQMLQTIHQHYELLEDSSLLLPLWARLPPALAKWWGQMDPQWVVYQYLTLLPHLQKSAATSPAASPTPLSPFLQQKENLLRDCLLLKTPACEAYSHLANIQKQYALAYPFAQMACSAGMVTGCMEEAQAGFTTFKEAPWEKTQKPLEKACLLQSGEACALWGTIGLKHQGGEFNPAQEQKAWEFLQKSCQLHFFPGCMQAYVYATEKKLQDQSQKYLQLACRIEPGPYCQ